jgi:hypothetical protein
MKCNKICEAGKNDPFIETFRLCVVHLEKFSFWPQVFNVEGQYGRQYGKNKIPMRE